MEKVTVIIPAYNEAENIGRVLSAVVEAKKLGIVHDVVVVNDGSTDATGKIAKKAGVNVINIPKRKGKGNAFLEGIKYCKNNKTDVIVTADADLSNLNHEHIKEMLAKLEKPVILTVGNKNIVQKMAMVVAIVAKGADHSYENSGQRAIKLKALQFLFTGKQGPFTSNPAKRFVRRCQGYGLEKTLNELFKLDDRSGIARSLTYSPKERLSASPAFRIGTMLQLREIQKTMNLIVQRKKKFHNILTKHNLRRKSQIR